MMATLSNERDHATAVQGPGDLGSEAERKSRRRRGSPLIIVSLTLLVLLIGAAIAAPMLTEYSPTRSDLPSRMMPPMWLDGGSPDHILGTDGFGRDIFSRVLYGARISLSVAGLSILLGGVLGAVLGILAGFVGGILDALVMRAVDILLAVPTILIAIALAVALGPSFRNVVLVLSFLLWPRVARQVRGEALVVKRQDFVRYAETIGVPKIWIMLRHVLPNVTPTLLVVSTLEIGQVILLEASLSFIGAGVPPPQPSWGVVVAEGRALLVTGWWIALFPGLAIVITVLVFNTLGDWLRDTLDPRLKRR